MTTLFFGGWQVPYLMRDGFHFRAALLAMPALIVSLTQLVAFMVKVVALCIFLGRCAGRCRASATTS